MLSVINPLERRQIVSKFLNTLLYESLDAVPSDKSVYGIQKLVSTALEGCRQDVRDAIECKQSRSHLNTVGIFCKSTIAKAAKIGPYDGEFCALLDEYKCFNGDDCMEIYDTGKDSQPTKISGFLASSSEIENWMQFVRYARNKREQNLEIVQMDNKIYFIAIRDIQENEELLIWYGDLYNLKCGVPSLEQIEFGCSTPTPVAEDNEAPLRLEEIQYPHTGQPSDRSQDQLLHGLFLPSEDGPKQKVWKCVRCTKTFISTGSLRAHARIHTGEKPYTCSYCQRSFCQMSTLRSHIRLHTGEKPFKCSVCHRSFTQSAGLRSHKKTHKSPPVGVFIYSTPNALSPTAK